MATNTNNRCLLLELPPELQNMIFKLVCTDNFDVRSSACTRRVKKHQAVVRKPPGLLLVNKQIHLNALQMFYATAAFQFLGHRRIATTIIRWLDSIRKRCNNHIILKVKILVNSESLQQPGASMSLARAAHSRAVLESVKAAMGPQVSVDFVMGLDPRAD